MKKLFIFLLFLLTSFMFSSCSKVLIQVFEVKEINLKKENNLYVFENDTVKISYSFWANHGVLAFTVYNKLDVPFYINWKKSSFIYNTGKINYFINEEYTSTDGNYKGSSTSYFYTGPSISPSLTSSSGYFQSSSTTTKPEEITFIPPKSNYSRSQFILLPGDFYKFSNNVIISEEQRNDKPKKTTTVKTENFDYTNSTIKFRNFIAISINENSTNNKFIDNEFYISSIKEMDINHFRGEKIEKKEGVSHSLIGGENNEIYSKPLKKPTSFYIKLYEEWKD